MRTSKYILAACFAALTIGANAQQNFDKIRISSSGSVEVRQGEPASVTTEDSGDPGRLYNISSDGWLNVTGSSSDKLIITVPSLTRIHIAGSGKVETGGHIKLSEIDLVVSGVGKIEMDLECTTINCDISGSGKIELSGSGETMNVNISGSGKIDAEKFKVKNCTANISGSGKCLVDVTDNLNSNISGTGSVYYLTKPATVVNNSSGIGRVAKADSTYSDTTRISLGNTQILVIEEDEDVSDILHFQSSDKLKAHWAGFELGVNMLMDSDFSTDPPAGYGYLEPKIEKSIAVNFNVIDLEMKLTQNKKVMLMTGLGYSINNYRFKSDAFLVPDAEELTASYDSSEYKKNKLVVHYLTVPLLFEFNTSTNPRRTFHFAAGVIGGLRIGSHQKLVKETGSKDYTIKTYDDFNMNPFKAEATVRMGYGNFTVFGTYSLVSLFKDNKGPEMYPVTAGIRLIGW